MGFFSYVDPVDEISSHKFICLQNEMAEKDEVSSHFHSCNDSLKTSAKRFEFTLDVRTGGRILCVVFTCPVRRFSVSV